MTTICPGSRKSFWILLEPLVSNHDCLPTKHTKLCKSFYVDLPVQLSRYSANTIEDCLLVQRLLVWLPAATTSYGAYRMTELRPAKAMSFFHISKWNCDAMVQTRSEQLSLGIESQTHVRTP